MLPFQGYRLHKPDLYSCSIKQGKEREYIMNVIIQCGHCGGSTPDWIYGCIQCGQTI